MPAAVSTIVQIGTITIRDTVVSPAGTIIAKVVWSQPQIPMEQGFPF